MNALLMPESPLNEWQSLSQLGREFLFIIMMFLFSSQSSAQLLAPNTPYQAGMPAGPRTVSVKAESPKPVARGNENNKSDSSITSAEKDPHIYVILETDLGDMTLKLYPHLTPKTVANFLKYVEHGRYDGVIFHHAQKNYMLQTGTYNDRFEEIKTDLPIQNEQFSGGVSNSRGTISMARPPEKNVNLATSQFFINLKHNFRLNGSTRTPGYTVFGEVAEGMDIAEKIVSLPQGEHSDRGLPYAPNKSVRIKRAYLLPSKEAKVSP